jgi:hypothetical protein
MKHCGLALCLAWVCIHGAFAAPAPATPLQIPALGWEERSDWINLKTDVTPAAIGDGQADDTAAIQRAFAEVHDGSILYFPPGTYRITAPLMLKNATGARWIGGLIIGHGRETKWIWDGREGGTMLLLNPGHRRVATTCPLDHRPAANRRGRHAPRRSEHRLRTALLR